MDPETKPPPPGPAHPQREGLLLWSGHLSHRHCGHSRITYWPVSPGGAHVTWKTPGGQVPGNASPRKRADLPYSSSNRAARPRTPQHCHSEGPQAACRGSPARDRPSMSPATSMVEARCIARALAPWRGLCSLAVMMSLVRMTSRSWVRARLSPQKPRHHALVP